MLQPPGCIFRIRKRHGRALWAATSLFPSSVWACHAGVLLAGKDRAIWEEHVTDVQLPAVAVATSVIIVALADGLPSEKGGGTKLLVR